MFIAAFKNQRHLLSALLAACTVCNVALAEETIVIARYSSSTFETKNKLQFNTEASKKQNLLFQKIAAVRQKSSTTSHSGIRDRVRISDPASKSIEKDLSQAPTKRDIPSLLLNLLMLKF